MDTRTTEDRMDEQLRAAGARLRASAPSPAVTDAALAEMPRPAGSRHRVWWVAPAGVVAAAAATVGVLALTGGPDEAVEQVPAVTPPVTAAPTVPATPPATPPATEPPVFAGDPPLSASAAVFGCPGTLGEIAAAIDPSLDPVLALGCSGLDAQAVSLDTVIGLRRQDDGTWSEVTRESSDCLPVHCSFQFDVLPIPPAALLARDLGDLRAQDVTPQFRVDTAQIAASEPEEYAELVGDRLAGDEEPVPTVTADAIDGADVVLITLSGLGDDSVGEVTYVVWYDDSRPELAVKRAFLISRCSRGVAVDEVGEPMDLCI